MSASPPPEDLAGASRERALVIGVLALQGGSAEHLEKLDAIPRVKGIPITRSAEMEDVDALILPGGESSAIGMLLEGNGMLCPLRERIAGGLPVWGTCAGMILLARELRNDSRRHLAVMDIAVERNAYGTQGDSFVCEAPVKYLEGSPFPLVFIRDRKSVV